MYLRNEQQQGRLVPLLYQSGIKYKLPEPMQLDYSGVEGQHLEVLEKAVRFLPKSRQAEVERTIDWIKGQFQNGEHFRDIMRIRENGGGDCFPLGARVVRRDETGLQSRVLVSSIQRGDSIFTRGRFGKVLSVESKGVLPLDGIHLAGDKNFLLTRGHKVFVVGDGGTVKRIAVGQLEAGMDMLRPITWLDYRPNWLGETVWAPLIDKHETTVKVTRVTRDAEELACVDFETDDHYVYLPDMDVITSQCDNMSGWRAAECRFLGYEVMPFLSVSRESASGGTVYHALNIWPDGSSEDPSLILGMAQPQRWAEREMEIAKNIERRRMQQTGELLAQWPRQAPPMLLEMSSWQPDPYQLSQFREAA